jgi:hypothetical protein
MSKLWTACQSSYRPSAAYQVSVVLIQAEQPTRPGLPVLTRGVVANPSLTPPLPTLSAVVPAGQQPVIRLGETVQLLGHHLDGTGREVRLRNERHGIDQRIAATGPSMTESMAFTVPSASATDYPVGVYEVGVELVPVAEASPRESNRLACVIAPNVTNLPLTVARDGDSNALITLQFTPELRAGQTVSLRLGQQEIHPEGFVAPTSSLAFVARGVAAGSELASLRIDGIDSPLVDRSQSPPVFFNQRVTFT